MAIVRVALARDCPETAWGFRLQGGKDLNQPLTIQRVFANTPSEGELHRGDVIVALNGRDTTTLTHKHAQDAISRGGGQIELLVQRPPPGQVNIKPLSPTKDTRAPAFPTSPTRAPHIIIPIQKKIGPSSPSRIIPISPVKSSPPKHTPPKPAPKPVQQQHQQFQKQQQQQQYNGSMNTSGFQPKKVTLNKYGGGNISFGSSPAPRNAPKAQAYRPVPAPTQMTHQPAAPAPSYDQYDYSSHVQTQQQTTNQFSAPQPSSQFSPQTPTERGVEEEEYGSLADRRRNFMKGAAQPPTIQRSRKPLPTFGRPRHGEDSVSFGVDYTKPQQSKPVSQKHTSTPRPRPPPVNRRDDDDVDSGWSGTLKGERSMKPWELEALEAAKYQEATMDTPYRPGMAPSTAPKPRITQITTQSRAVSSDYSAPPSHRSVSPYYSLQAQSRSPVPQYSPNAPQQNIAGGPEGGPAIVHLQYNSPMGLYSNDNIQDTYTGQTQGRALQPSSLYHDSSPAKKQPLAPGERNWDDSDVYRMVHSTKKTTTSTRTDGTGQNPKGETVTTTRTSHETKYPGQEPQRHVTETVQRGGVPDYSRYALQGMSDF